MRAGVWSLAGVDTDVHVVCHALVETLPAVLTTVLLPVSVYLHVGTQISTVVEVFAALWTGSCKFSSTLVNGTMIFVVTKLAELFTTLSTLERFLPGMRS